MERVKEYLKSIADNNEIKTNGSKIEQRTRNAIRNEFTDILAEALHRTLGSDEIIVARTKEGIGLALDNRKIGFIPIVLKPVFKDTAEDILELADDYEQECKEKAEKQRKQAELKAKKLAQAKKKKTE